jgi:hypothetical protein
VTVVGFHVPTSRAPFPLLLSRPKDQQYSVILHLRFLMRLRSQFTSISYDGGVLFQVVWVRDKGRS